jgi:hypothetical protein
MNNKTKKSDNAVDDEEFAYQLKQLCQKHNVAKLVAHFEMGISTHSKTPPRSFEFIAAWENTLTQKESCRLEVVTRSLI